MLSCGGCDLIAGNYKCTVIDAVGTSHDYFATITQPPAISSTISHTDDNGSCTGSATVTVNGGTPGYTYSWTPGGYTGDIITNLCQNTYSLIITDGAGCVSIDTVHISFTTGIAHLSASSNQISIYPNPTSDQFCIKANTTGKLNVDLYDVNGRHVFNTSVSDKEKINVAALDNGIYTVTIKTAGLVTNKKLVIVR